LKFIALMAKQRGRPLEITPELIVKAYQLARDTLYVECVAGLLGISRSTLYRWLRRGSRERRRRERGLIPKEKEQLFLEFSDSVKKGFYEAEKADLETIQKATSEHWQASAWRLERTHPERWSLNRDEILALKKQMVELTKQLQEIKDAKTPKN
jgi:transposase